jgi:hypothetical protein
MNLLYRFLVRYFLIILQKLGFFHMLNHNKKRMY